MIRWIGSGFSEQPDDDRALAFHGGDRIVEVDYYIGAEKPARDSDGDEPETGWPTF